MGIACILDTNTPTCCNLQNASRQRTLDFRKPYTFQTDNEKQDLSNLLQKRGGEGQGAVEDPTQESKSGRGGPHPPPGLDKQCPPTPDPHPPSLVQ